MKTNTKVVLWLFVAVPFVVAFVLASSSPSGLIVQAKRELGPVAWNEMAKISGGGGEAGCAMSVKDCTYSGNGRVVACPCGNGEISSLPDPKAGTEYAGATYNVPGSSSTNQKYANVTGTPRCSRPVSCTIVAATNFVTCNSTSGSCTYIDDPSSRCADYEIIRGDDGDWETVDKGTCNDP